MTQKKWTPKIIDGKTEPSAAEPEMAASSESLEKKAMDLLKAHPHIAADIEEMSLNPETTIYIAYANGDSGISGMIVSNPAGSLTFGNASRIALLLDMLQHELINNALQGRGN